MAKTETDMLSGKEVTLYLSTPLCALGETKTQSPVFVIQATITSQVGSGLLIEIKKCFDDAMNPVSFAHKTMLLPFSKLDHAAF